MTKQNLLEKTEKAISDLLSAFVSNGSINVLGTTYSLKKAGRYHILVSGSRGAEYSIGVSPKSTVIEDKECVVFFINRYGSRECKNFTAFDGEIVELSKV